MVLPYNKKVYICNTFLIYIQRATVKFIIQMLVIRRKVVSKGNSLQVSIPKKEIIGEEVILLDIEAFNLLFKK